MVIQSMSVTDTAKSSLGLWSHPMCSIPTPSEQAYTYPPLTLPDDPRAPRGSDPFRPQRLFAYRGRPSFGAFRSALVWLAVVLTVVVLFYVALRAFGLGVG
jgi:hypothetical protein